ncbi:MAG: phytanoyl-CoA dioxygenase family protein, partial [Rubripirellula sp.]
DADEANGCMEVFTGSHQHGLIDFEVSDDESSNVLDQSVKNPEQYGAHNCTPLRAGQISIHSDLLVHGSAANDSDRRRCGLTLRYCPADVTAYLGWNRKGVSVNGNADSILWPGAKRPENA